MNQHLNNMYCDPKPFSITELYVERNSIDENPAYQRESAIWSQQKQELFIDSMINNYDIPKIYFHDLRGQKGLKKYAIVDGKQRLHTVYQFLENVFPLGDSFRLNEDAKCEKVTPGMYFTDFAPDDKERFKGIILSIVLIQNATEDDIEDLFSRLNNGEPLNAAESRNGKIGDMTNLIREVAKDSFFTEKLRFKNKRFSHLEVSAKFILLEKSDLEHSEIFSDLKKKYLDGMVDTKRKMTEVEKEGLSKRVFKNLTTLKKIFSDNDPLLAKQSTPPVYYIFSKLLHGEYGHSHLNTLIRNFLEQFEVKRQQNLLLPEDDRDSTLIEYSRLMQQGTNDISNLRYRVSILRRYFLLDNTDVRLLDPKRQFTSEERLAIYILSGKECSACGKKLNDISEMEADHPDQHAFGGETTLKNARALCIECNEKLKKTVK